MAIVSNDALRKLAPKAKAGILATLVAPLNEHLPNYGITSALRVQHFLAQAAQETDGFKTLVEYASGRAYEGRKDLGNVHRGDGERFKGRGIFQLTGRANYEAYGRRLGVDLVSRPEKAAHPDIAVRVACEYWKAKGLNAWADRDDLKEITRRINGGYNGLRDRGIYLRRAKGVLPLRMDSLPAAPVPSSGDQAPSEEVPDAPIAAEPAKPWWRSTEVQASAGGMVASVVAAVSSPWGFATIALLIVIATGAWIIHRRLQREAADKPTLA